jgi:hypothetical protein
MLLLSQNWASYMYSNVPSFVHTSFSRVYFETFFRSFYLFRMENLAFAGGPAAASE